VRRENAHETSDDLGFAKVDLSRLHRQGASEVIYAAGKTSQQIIEILSSLKKHHQTPIIVTRIDEAKASSVISVFGDEFSYYPEAKFGRLGDNKKQDGIGTITIAAAGTSDIPVAEEAALTAETLGNNVKRLYDVGVAGIHRLLAHADDINNSSVVIAVAGMEGALASVVGGLAKCPVIAVPTSVGYGASFNGISALLSMLNSCAAGIATVNIDNGFGAGFLAHRINHMGLI
jgi:NCAIR mutase (PurE)-related protein